MCPYGLCMSICVCLYFIPSLSIVLLQSHVGNSSSCLDILFHLSVLVSVVPYFSGYVQRNKLRSFLLVIFHTTLLLFICASARLPYDVTRLFLIFYVRPSVDPSVRRFVFEKSFAIVASHCYQPTAAAAAVPVSWRIEGPPKSEKLK